MYQTATEMENGADCGYKCSNKEQTQTPVIRIGSVPYLNSKVLTFGLQPRTERYTFETHIPSVLAKKLRNGLIDVALLSSVEFFRNPQYQIVPNISVSSHGEIWSVQLYHRKPLRLARRIGLDPASETTNALLQIILQEKMNLGIELVPLKLDDDPLKRDDLDGFLKIGDPCLLFRPPAGYDMLDLAAEWQSFSNLPFVFAMWMCRAEVDLEGVNMDLFLAKKEGLRNIETIAREESPKLGLEFARTKQYISRIVKYDLGREELGGLSLFGRYLERQRIVEQCPEFDFYTR